MIAAAPLLYIALAAASLLWLGWCLFAYAAHREAVDEDGREGR